jgi:hypothetical protein
MVVVAGQKSPKVLIRTILSPLGNVPMTLTPAEAELTANSKAESASRDLILLICGP